MAHGGRVLDCLAACVGAGAGCGCLCVRALALEEEMEERKALVTGSSQVVRLSDLVVQDAGFHLLAAVACFAGASPWRRARSAPDVFEEMLEREEGGGRRRLMLIGGPILSEMRLEEAKRAISRLGSFLPRISEKVVVFGTKS